MAGNRLIILLSLILLGWILSQFSMNQSNDIRTDTTGSIRTVRPNETKTSRTEIENHIDRWFDFISSHVNDDTHLADVDRFMTGKFRERGFIALGGSGARELRFHVDDAVEVIFFLTHEKKVDHFNITNRTKWLRDRSNSDYIYDVIAVSTTSD